jgi:hypothetical protein
MAGLMGVAGGKGRIREIHIQNTTATACVVAIRRVSAAGTPGATKQVTAEDDELQTALLTPKDLWTVTPTFAPTTDPGRIARLGAFIGAGVMFTFGGNGLFVPASTAAGIVIIGHGATPQVCDVTFVWDE